MKQNKLFLLAFLFLSFVFFSCQEKNSNAAEKTTIKTPKLIDSLVFKIEVDTNNIIYFEGEIIELENITTTLDSLLYLYPEQIQRTLRVQIKGNVDLDMNTVKDIRDELRKSKSATKYLNKNI